MAVACVRYVLALALASVAVVVSVGLAGTPVATRAPVIATPGSSEAIRVSLREERSTELVPGPRMKAWYAELMSNTCNLPRRVDESLETKARRLEIEKQRVLQDTLEPKVADAR